MALNEFEGTVMLVSHDRALLREVCDEFWLVTAGKVGPFDGDLDDYQKWLLDQSKEAAKAAKEAAKRASSAPAPAAVAVVVEAPPPPAPIVSREDRKASGQARMRLAEQTKPMRKEMERIDAQLNKLAEEREKLEARLAEGTAPPAEIVETGKRLKAIHDELEAAELRWLELSAEVEAIQASA
jgi:ATP-binding cassette subfamily F protein 3